MYITETTDNVRKLMEEIEQELGIETCPVNWPIGSGKEFNNKGSTKVNYFCVSLLNNNQINDKNEANPDLMEDNNVKIFNLESIGLPFNACTVLLRYFVMLYNGITNTKDIYEDTGNIKCC